MTARKSAADKKTTEQQANEDAANAGQYSAGPGANPFWQSGNVVTTEGGSGSRVEDVAPIFAQARAEALDNAAKNPDSELVVLPEDGEDKSNKEAVADLKDSAKDAKADAKTASEGGPVVLKDGEVE